MDVRATACWIIAVVATTISSDSTWSQCPDSFHPNDVVPVRSPDVVYLNLYNCNLTTLEPASFKNVPNLQALHLANNSIITFDTAIFKSTTKLEELYFSNNDLHGMATQWKLTNLKKVIITHTDMTKIDLSVGHKLITLELGHCYLNSIPSVITFGSFPEMTKLILSHNYIRAIEWDSLGNAENLQELDLGYNLIEKIDENLFNCTTKIDTINLRNNKLEHLPEKLFRNTPDLMSINLRNNRIKYVPANLFENASPLTINLSYNMLTYMPDEFMLNDKNKLTDFFLDHNPWQCACLNEILVKLKRNYINYLPEDSKEFRGEEAACVMANFQCFKPENHMKFYKKMKEGG